MSTRWYCDICDAEVPKPEMAPKFATMVSHNGGLASLDFQITRSIDGKAWNGGHLCDGCLATGFEYAARVLRGIHAQRRTDA